MISARGSPSADNTPSSDVLVAGRSGPCRPFSTSSAAQQRLIVHTHFSDCNLHSFPLPSTYDMSLPSFRYPRADCLRISQHVRVKGPNENAQRVELRNSPIDQSDTTVTPPHVV
jgi:hypothetical protein